MLSCLFAGSVGKRLFCYFFVFLEGTAGWSVIYDTLLVTYGEYHLSTEGSQLIDREEKIKEENQPVAASLWQFWRATA